MPPAPPAFTSAAIDRVTAPPLPFALTLFLGATVFTAGTPVA